MNTHTYQTISNSLCHVISTSKIHIHYAHITCIYIYIYVHIYLYMYLCLYAYISISPRQVCPSYRPTFSFTSCCAMEAMTTELGVPGWLMVLPWFNSQRTMKISLTGWWLTYPSEKYESQLG